MLTRFGVAEHGGTAAERRAATEVPAAATATHAAPPYCRHNLYLLGGTHYKQREREQLSVIKPVPRGSLKEWQQAMLC